MRLNALPQPRSPVVITKFFPRRRFEKLQFLAHPLYPLWQPFSWSTCLQLLSTKGLQGETRWNSTGCHRRFCLRLMWPWLLTFWSQNLISIAMNPRTSVTKIWWNSLHWFLRYGVHKVIGTHRLTHGRTHPKNRMPPTPNVWRKHNKNELTL